MTVLGVDGATTVSDQDLLNRMNETGRLTQLGDKVFSQKVSFLGLYDFAEQGGAITAHDLLDSKGESLKVPAHFVCTNVIIDRVTAVQSSDSTADISVGLNSTADLLASVAETDAAATTLLAGIPVGTVATTVKTTAEKTATLSVITKALTAGKWYVQIEGYLSRSF